MMTQLEKIREAQARRIGICPRLRARERGKFGICRRQKDDVARCLAEIDRFRSVGNNARRNREQVHL
jgi:hypothetical protein